MRTTRQADEDLVGVYEDGAALFGVAQAERYFAELMDCLALVERAPMMGRERLELRPPVRLHFHRSHVIAYLADAEGVLVVRVLGGRQDWAAHFRM